MFLISLALPSDDLINISIIDNKDYLKLNFNIDKYESDHDKGGFEIRSNNFESIAVQDAITDITQQRNEFEKYIKQLLTDDNSVMFCDEVSFYDRNQWFIIDKSFNEDRTGDEFSIRDRYKYNGDLELNITLPHPKTYYNSISDDEIKKFQQKHMTLMKALQYLSPLFLGCFSGTFPDSFGDNGKHPETSYNYLSKGGLCRILTTDVSKIYSTTGKYHYSATHETILNAFNHFSGKRTGLKQAIKLFVNRGYDRHEIEFSVNRNIKQYDPTNKNFFGFEWKILDQIPLNDAANITLFVIMIAQHLDDKGVKIDNDPRNDFKLNEKVASRIF